MRLRLRGLSRSEDEFEAWVAQRHQERVLEGNATPVGPCPEEAFLKELAKKSNRIALEDPSRPWSELPHLHEAVARPTARTPFAAAETGAHSRGCLLSADSRLVRRTDSPRTEFEAADGQPGSRS